MTTQQRQTTPPSFSHILLGMLAGAVFTFVAFQVWQAISVFRIEALALTLSSILPDALYDLLSEQAARMGLPLTADTQAYWFMARAGGIVAYLLLWLATIWGIVMSSKVAKGLIGPLTVYGLHEILPLLATIFAAIHALVLLGDPYIQFEVIHLLIPLTSPYKPLWTGLGTIALLFLIALVVSFYVRKQIGQRTWRLFHFAAYLAFVLALLHGVMAGSDSALPGMQGMYFFSGATVLFLTYYRILMHRPHRKASARGGSQVA